MYFKTVVITLIVWAIVMTTQDSWGLFNDFWEVPTVMVIGSFIAGFSAEGGGAVAFPIFTKVLHIPPVDAKQFSLLIQSVGMTMASLVIIAKKIPYYRFAIFSAILGGVIGQVLSVMMGWFVAGPQLRWIFTINITALGLALLCQHFWGLKEQKVTNQKVGRRLLFFSGFIGGFLTINIGCGADMVAFIILTLVLDCNVKKATPTTVIIMALNSIIGVIVITLSGAWSSWAISAWKTAIPIVIFGAPLGAFIASKANNTYILFGLLLFISIEVISTIMIVPLESWVIPLTIVIMGLLIILLYFKRRKAYLSSNLNKIRNW